MLISGVSILLLPELILTFSMSGYRPHDSALCHFVYIRPFKCVLGV